MSTENKIFITASELAELLQVSTSKAYALIRKFNNELASQGYATLAGKCPRRYFEKKWFGYEESNTTQSNKR